ncbi:RIP metalloprotease RseP [Pseudomonadales bacterium]|nr:RIP metalloprotease RseP [Pseudomonadales bacterium]
MDWLQYPLAFLLLLGVIVVFHEFGHFIVARRSGVHVVRFSVGFGRPLLRWVDQRGTEFVLALIPFGGYVQMYDDRDPLINAEAAEGTVPREAKGYTHLSPLWRIAISLAGPAANFVLAIVIYAALFMAGSLQFTPTFDAPRPDTALANTPITNPFEVLAVDDQEVRNYQDIAMGLGDRLGESGNIQLDVVDLSNAEQKSLSLSITDWHRGVAEPDLFGSLGLQPARLSIVGQVFPGSAAATAGLQEGDWIVAVDGEPISRWSQWVEYIVASPNRPLQFEARRQGRSLFVTAIPEPFVQTNGEEVGRLGIAPVRAKVSYGLFESLQLGAVKTWDMTVMTLSMMKKMIFGSVSAENLVGPVGIVKIAGDSVRVGWQFFLNIMALMSVSLGVLNLLPIPMLDGGHVVFTSIEMLRGKPLPERMQMAVMQVGIVMLGAVMIFVTYNDLTRLL